MRLAHLRAALRAFTENPWLSLTVLLAMALPFRLYDLDAVAPWGDEYHDACFSVAHAVYPNPFTVPEIVYGADTSQARLPYYLTALGVKLISGGDIDTFQKGGGLVDGSAARGWVSVATAIVLICIALALAAPAPLGRWAGLLPVFCVLPGVLLLGLPHFPVSQLWAARIVAGLVGAGGVLASYALGREVFGHWAGLYAAAALAFCPTCIGWNRCAVTAGDTFVTTFFALALWCLYRAIRYGTGAGVVACIVVYALSIGAKFSAVLLLPITVLYVVVLWLSREQVGSEQATDHTRRRLKSLAVLHGVLIVPLLVVFFWPLFMGRAHLLVRTGLWAGALVACVVGYVRLLRPPWTFTRRHLGWVALNLCLGGTVAAAFTTPFHAQGEALGGVIEWWRGWLAPGTGREREYLKEFVQTAGLLLIQIKPPTNLLALCGIAMACRPKHFRRGSLFVLSIGVYLTAITLMPNRWTYYVMPMMPLCHVLAGGAVAWLLRWVGQRSPWASRAVAAALLACLAYEFYGAVRIHPYYLLDDRPWQRALVLRPETYPINMQMQAVRPAVEWLARNIPHGARIAIAFPYEVPSDDRILRQWVDSIWSFEVRRLRKDPSKELVPSLPRGDSQRSEFDYLVYFPETTGSKPYYPGFVEAYEVNLNGTPAGWVYKRWH